MARIAGGLGVGGEISRAVEAARRRRLAPINVEPVAAGEGRLQGVCHHGDAVRQAHGPDNAWHGPGLTVIDARRCFVLDRCAQHGGVKHAVNAHVDGVGLTARALCRDVEPRDILADQPVFAARLCRPAAQWCKSIR